VQTVSTHASTHASTHTSTRIDTYPPTLTLTLRYDVRWIVVYDRYKQAMRAREQPLRPLEQLRFQYWAVLEKLQKPDTNTNTNTNANTAYCYPLHQEQRRRLELDRLEKRTVAECVDEGTPAHLLYRLDLLIDVLIIRGLFTHLLVFSLFACLLARETRQHLQESRRELSRAHTNAKKNN